MYGSKSGSLEIIKIKHHEKSLSLATLVSWTNVQDDKKTLLKSIIDAVIILKRLTSRLPIL